jgi:microcystin-dependent protein
VGTIADWNEDRLWNFIRLRLSQLPDNTRGLIARAIDGITFPNVPPAGSIFHGGWAAAPDGYLPCDGAAVSRSTYADLFTAIGTTFGVGDGSTTFNVPDALAIGQREATLAFPSGLPVASRTPAHSHQHIHAHGMEHDHTFSDTSTTDGAGKVVADDPHTHNYPGGGGANTTGNNSANATVARHGHDHDVSGITGLTSNGGQTGDLAGSGDEDTATAFGAYLTLLAVIKT